LADYPVLDKTKKLILVVDDDPVILKLLVSSLAKEYSVLTAVDGEDAISKAIESRPDLLVTDVVMPKKNGFELCKAFKFNPELLDVPIIILTALGRSSDKFEGFRTGADEFIVKPFSPSELRSRVAHLLKISDPIDHDTPSWEATLGADERSASTGAKALDDVLGGGLPAASNILLIGPVDSGISSFCRNFLATGLEHHENCMMVTIDNGPSSVRRELDELLGGQPSTYYEASKLLAIVDAFSWCAEVEEVAKKSPEDSFCKINHLLTLIAKGGVAIGQNPIARKGGKRVIDSISKLFTLFEPAAVKRVLHQATRAATTQGRVCTIFTLDKGSVQEDTVNDIITLMDGVFESKLEGGDTFLRVSSIKHLQVPDTWIRL
jgi:CheY-like chemotaxis protein